MRILLVLLLISVAAHAEEELGAPEPAPAPEQHHHHGGGPADCGGMSVFDITTGMCEPLPMKGMSMWHAMIHGNAFLTGISESSPRGRISGAIPDHVMASGGVSLGGYNYLTLDLMLTAERWLFPIYGYSELLQQGENDYNGNPFIDNQHPHSSPIMGLSLSDTIRWGESKDNLKVYFAPRGPSTDGPVAFMHRPTGEVNPDAPLGHHIGQDVGHISSTVIGTQLRLSDTQLEVSTFNGTEPSPDAVDLPFGVPNSAAIRGTQYFGRDYVAMLSFAYVGTPEPSDPTIPWVARISASGYGVWPYRSIKIYAASIYGGIIGYDHASYLMSFTEELRVQAEHQAFWARIEVLQRTAAELAIATAPGDPNAGHFVGEIMVGYTHEIVSAGGFTLAAGGAFHQDFLPTEFQAAYGGGTPWGFRAFVQLSGMEHWGGMF